MDSLQLDQGSSVWLQWRGRGIGSSDAPSIMGASPWRTRRELYFEKIAPTHGMERRAPNYAQQKGIDLEPIARAAYELIKDMDMPPVLKVHPEYEWMRASLDGFNEEHGVILEIKCPGKDDHAKAKAGVVPEKYVWQLEHQLMTTGAKRADYFSYYVDNKTKIADHVLIEYFSDPAKREQLMKEELEFWNCVQTKTPPALTDKDFMELEETNDTSIFSKIATAYHHYAVLTERAEEAKSILDSLKEKAVGAMPHPRVRCAGVEMIKVVRRGSVDYSKVPALAGVDLESYRHKEVVSYQIKLVGN